MINKGVWRKSKRGNMSPNRRLIDSKWVFDKKRDGQLRALIVAWGDTQIQGVELTENYLPLVTYFTLCVILLMGLVNKWYSQNIDIETAFFVQY